MLSPGKPSYWTHVKPAGALADFRAVWREAGRRRWLFIVMSGMTTFAIFSVMAGESWKGPPRKPQVTYINSWSASRSDAEIMASNIANQKLQDRLRAEQAARDEKVKAIYRTIGRASGMDVDAIEKKAKIDEATEKAAEQAKIGLGAHAAPGAGPSAGPRAPATEAAPVGQR